MVIRGNIRGNGPQLAHYLLTEGGNERIQIVEVDGRVQASPAYLQQVLHTMSLTAELTRTDKGLYHAQINPAYSEDKSMSADDWQRAADILGHELGLGEQRRVIVLHTKKDRTHAHVVFERYDHKTGNVINNKFSRLAQDRARKEMERVFEHERTPHRNKHHPELKDRLTNLWQTTNNARDFIQAVNKEGCMLAEGVPRRPFMVVDENGRSFELVRQLKGVRIKEVRQRLRGASLVPEKEAIELMRQKKDSTSEASNPHVPAIDQADNKTAHKTPYTARQFSRFWEMGAELTQESTERQQEKRQQAVATAFLESGPELTADLRQTDTEQPERTDASDSTREQQAKGDEEKARQRAKLQAFMQAEEELVAPAEPEPDKQRQQERARQFLANQELLTANQADSELNLKQSTPPTGNHETKDATSEKERLQQLMDEQKAVRERQRKRLKRPSRR